MYCINIYCHSVKNPTVALPEVSKLIDSAIRKRQGYQRKHRFLRNKYSVTEKMTFVFHISKCLACNAEKPLLLKITKNRHHKHFGKAQHLVF